MDNIKELLANIEIKYKSFDLYVEALTHRSYLNENRKEKRKNNERLEFLGDAVLELIISHYLYHKFRDRSEGDLTSFRAALVRTDSLAFEARKLNYGKYLMMSKGEEATGGREKDYLLANTFEAVLGAIFEDLGYEECKKFIFKHLIPKIDEIVKLRSDIDSKTRFQEIAQAKFKVTPIYEVISEEGPDHEKLFTVGVYIDGKLFGKGVGVSKQKAEEDAAKHALQKLRV